MTDDVREVSNIYRLNVIRFIPLRNSTQGQDKTGQEENVKNEKERRNLKSIN